MRGKWPDELSISRYQWAIILIVCSLALVNWFLEVLRWKLSLDQMTKSSVKMAARQVFAGLALNWIIPFTGGDLVARLIPNSDRKMATLLIAYNRAIMLAITVIFGAFAMYQYSSDSKDSIWLGSFGLVFVLILVLALVRRFLRLERMKTNWIVQISVLSIMRYSVFTVQFYLLLLAWNPALPMITLIAGIGWIFFFRSMVPSLFGNLGVREASALIFFESISPEMILIPSLLIWVINTVLPSGLGLYYLIRFPVKIAR